jgi:hypothetical protein
VRGLAAQVPVPLCLGEFNFSSLAPCGENVQGTAISGGEGMVVNDSSCPELFRVIDIGTVEYVIPLIVVELPEGVRHDLM